MFVYTPEIVTQLNNIAEALPKTKDGIALSIRINNEDFKGLLGVGKAHALSSGFNILRDARVPQGYALTYYKHSEEMGEFLNRCKNEGSSVSNAFTKLPWVK